MEGQATLSPHSTALGIHKYNWSPSDFPVVSMLPWLRDAGSDLPVVSMLLWLRDAGSVVPLALQHAGPTSASSHNSPKRLLLCGKQARRTFLPHLDPLLFPVTLPSSSLISLSKPCVRVQRHTECILVSLALPRGP